MRTNYKLNARLNHRVRPEIKYMYPMESVEEVQHIFLLARSKGETIRLDGVGQAHLISKRNHKSLIIGLINVSADLMF